MDNLVVKRVSKILVLLGILIFFWTRISFEQIYLDTDLGRDLSELSNIWLGKVVWLGPHLTAGFHASPLYYYVLYPGLVISGGNALSLFITTMLIGVAGIGVFAWFAEKKWGWAGVVAAGILGLLPWWKTVIIHPGNGYTYALWLFLGLTGLWFNLPLTLSALAMGVAIANHPAAVFGLPILAYEWWKRGHSWLDAILIGLGLALPWAPIILFEIITKGYLISSWLAQPATSVSMSGSFSMYLVSGAVAFPYISAIFLLALFGIVAYYSTTRTRIWMVLSFLSLSLFTVFKVMPSHYLLGVSTLFWFSLLVGLVQLKWGRVLLSGAAIIVVLSLVFAHPPPPAVRSVPKLERTVEHLLDEYPLERSKKIAVVAALTQKTEVPQADDYRFFLRMQGYTVLEVSEYAQAEVLVMFIEEHNFDWQNWGNWEIDQFGAKKLVYQTRNEDFTIIVFEKR